MSFTSAENSVLTAIGSFLLAIHPDTKLFYLDEDWPSIDGPYFGLQITNIDKVGYPDHIGYDVNDKSITTQGYYLQVELIAFRGTSTENPNGMLHAALQYFRDEELHYKYFTANKVGILDFSNITKIDTVLDGVHKEKRSRMLVDVHVTIEEVSTLPSGIIETINWDSTIDGDAVTSSGSVTYP